MGEMKPFASLSSGLLARKGAARPAMRRPDPLSAARIDSLTHGNAAVSVPVDDLGWNDMGYDVDPSPVADPVTTPDFASSPVRSLSPMAADELVEEAEDEAAAIVAASAPAPTPAAIVQDAAPVAPARPAPKSRRRQAKAAFTLRLEAERHLRLRLACAVKNMSAQALVTQALDAFLATIPQIDTLAEQARADAADQSR